MIRLVYADRAPQLARALAQEIHAARHTPGASPLDAHSIITPDPASAAYLKMALAEQLGIAANLSFDVLRAYLGRLISDTDMGRVFDAARLELLLVDILGRADVLSDEALGPVARYLDAAGADLRARDLRRTQLAGLLAGLFDDYILTRPEMIEAWRSPDFEPETTIEGWERNLWLALQEPLKSSKLLSLPQAFRDFVPTPGQLPQRLHIWGLTVGSSVLQTIVARLAEHTELCLYTLNPCMEFWEDLQTGPKSLFGEDPFDLTPLNETPALQLWGRPGRENIRLLNALTECDFDARFSEPDQTPSSLLAQLQQDILLREPQRDTPAPERFEGDQSLQFTGCASIRREVEHVAQTIWKLVDGDPAEAGQGALRFDQIAVVLVGRDQDTYRAHIGAVFRERHGIPHHSLDVPLLGASRVVEAVELLLALPNSGFTRQDLLRLITHPVVLSRYEDISADDWLAWCDELTVVHGADHTDHEDTYIARDLYNWDQGLRRLVLGTFMSGRSSGDERQFSSRGQHYLPHQYPLDQLADASQLVLLVRSLIADARFAGSASMPIHQWAQYIRTLIGTYISPSTDQDERDQLRVLGALQHLQDLHTEGDPVSFTVAANLIRARLAGLTANRGQPLAEGVVVGPLSMLASLPFRAVFMPGFGEGRFPSSERRNQLDLRSLVRRAGDVSPRERDQYWFLERLMATQDSLHLSWVARSAQTGDQLEASPIVQQLRTMLDQGYLGAEGRAQIERQQALRRYDAHEPVDPFDSGAAMGERRILALRDDLSAHLAYPEELPPLQGLRQQLPGSTWQAVAQRLRIADPPASDPTPQPDLIEVPYRALRRFLQDPLQGWVEQVLRLRQDDIENDPYAREDELFRTEKHEESRLLLDVFTEHSTSPETSLETLYLERAKLCELSGIMPTGVFQESEQRRHLEILQAWHTHLRRAMAGRTRPITALRFGKAQEHARLRGVLDAIHIPLSDGRVVALQGSTEPLCAEAPASVVALAGDPLTGRLRTEPELRSFLDHALLVCAGREFPRGYYGWTTYGQATADGLARVRFDAFEVDEAQAWLGGLLKDLLDQTHAYLLPFATALAVSDARGKGRSAIEEALAKAQPSRFGPLASSQVKPPTVDEAVAMIERRFDPYWARRHEEGEA